MLALPNVGRYSPLVPLQGHPKDGGKPTSVQNFKQCSWLFILLRKRTGKRCGCTMIHELWLLVCLGKLVTKSSGKKYVDGPLINSNPSRGGP